MWFLFKEKVPPKIKIQSFFTRSCAEGKSGYVFLFRKHFWSYAANKYCSILQNNFSGRGKNNRKNLTKWPHKAYIV